MPGASSPLPDAAPADETRSRADARALLLDAAEHLFAEHGLEGVSLREIAAAAGQRNNSAVHYHFGDKQGLVHALMTDRLAKVEALRQAMVAEAGDLAGCDAAELLRLMWQPLVDVDQGRNGHWFIRFQLACYLQDTGDNHPLGRDPESYPASARIMDALHGRFPHLARDHFSYRLGLTALMFWSAVCWHDGVASSNNQRWSTRFSLGETIKMAAAALAAR